MTNLPPPSGAPTTLPAPPPAARPQPPALPPRPPLLQPSSNAPGLPPRPPSAPLESAAPVARPAGRLVQAVPMATLSDGMRVPLEHPPMRSTGAAGTAMLTSYLVVVGCLFVIALHETTAYRWITDGHIKSRASVAEAEQLDARTRLLVIVLLGLHVVAMVATAAWARRVAMNARSLGQQNVSVGASTWGWMLPFAWFFAGFSQLRKLPRIAGAVIGWQMAFVTPFVASYVVSRVTRFRTNLDTTNNGFVSADTLLSGIRSTWIVSLMFAGCSLLALLAAARAVVRARTLFREVDALRPT